MYMSEISKFKISDFKPQKITILWTLKHVSAISKHPVHNVKIIFRAVIGKMGKNSGQKGFLMNQEI